MKQRFLISRNTGGAKIVIKEYAELDKGMYSLLCEESYMVAAVEAALAKGPEQLLRLLRTESFFPTSFFAEKLIATLDDYIQQGRDGDVKIEADDTECISRVDKPAPVEGDGDIDDLLVADSEEIDVEDGTVGKLDAPIKIAEDEIVEAGNSL